MKPELAWSAKAYARRTDRTFTELVEDAVTDLLERSNGSAPKLPKIPVVKGKVPCSIDELKRLIEEQEYEHDMHRIGRKRLSRCWM